jgi:hypothetical protein
VMSPQGPKFPPSGTARQDEVWTGCAPPLPNTTGSTTCPWVPQLFAVAALACQATSSPDRVTAWHSKWQALAQMGSDVQALLLPGSVGCRTAGWPFSGSPLSELCKPSLLSPGPGLPGLTSLFTQTSNVTSLPHTAANRGPNPTSFSMESVNVLVWVSAPPLNLGRRR